jgi:hypothetical protein
MSTKLDVEVLQLRDREKVLMADLSEARQTIIHLEKAKKVLREELKLAYIKLKTLQRGFSNAEAKP